MTQNEKFQIQRRNTLRNLRQKLSGTPGFPVKLALAALYLMGAAYVCVKQAAWRMLAGNIPLLSPLLKAAMEHALTAYLLAGAATLPVLLLRASATAEDARLLELTSRPLHEEAEVAEALTLLRAHPVMDEARAEVARRAELARGYLSVLPAGSARDALSALCDQVAFRSA